MSDQKEQKQKNKKMENMREYFKKKTENKEVKKTFLQRKMFMSKKSLRERERDTKISDKSRYQRRFPKQN